jgi:hypothetical protein
MGTDIGNTTSNYTLRLRSIVQKFNINVFRPGNKMKIYFTVLLLSLFDQAFTFSQPCLSGGIAFSTQSDIDNFHINYPNCTEIEGNVSISGSGIKNLAGLSILVKINGDLNIYSNDSLINLSGLNGLTNIGGSLTLSVNPLLTNLVGLSGLKSIGGSIFLNYTTLNDLSGLDSLVYIGGDLQFTINWELSSLAGLESLSSMGGNIFIYYNNSLQSIAALMSLKSINGQIVIEGNPFLTDLSGLDSINPGTITNLAIFNNSSLSICALVSICSYLSSPNGTVNIYNNAAGCNSQEEVEDECELLFLKEFDQPEKSIIVFPNPCNDLITFDFPGNELLIAAVKIYNHLGRIVCTPDLNNRTIDVSTLNKGIYFLIFTMKNRTYTGTFIVDK